VAASRRQKKVERRSSRKVAVKQHKVSAQFAHTQKENRELRLVREQRAKSREQGAESRG
jgi:hypothetical protein